ncbi:MAG: hypothetical protein K2Q22_10935, partial [Cytophagales bacterium]|nr:hypothetical protein [Cytophagales bacterium]
IVSTASAIDLEDFGIEFRTNSVEDVDQAISTALQWDNDQLKQKSERIIEFTESNHSVEQFKSRAKSHIQSILDEK